MKDQLTFWQVVRMLWDVDGWREMDLKVFSCARYRDTKWVVVFGGASRIWNISDLYEKHRKSVLFAPLIWRIRRKIAAKS